MIVKTEANNKMEMTEALVGRSEVYAPPRDGKGWEMFSSQPIRN